MKQFLKIIASVFFIALFAQLTIDVPLNGNQIPISGQTFAVLLVGFFLGKKLGTIALLMYLIAGILGLPVFADGEAGVEVLQGGSGGFLLGFVFAAGFVGWLRELGWQASFWKILAAMTLGTFVIMAFGVARLTHLYDFQKAMEWGCYPFVPGAAVKIIIGAVAAYFTLNKNTSSKFS